VFIINASAVGKQNAFSKWSVRTDGFVWVLVGQPVLLVSGWPFYLVSPGACASTKREWASKGLASESFSAARPGRQACSSFEVSCRPDSSVAPCQRVLAAKIGLQKVDTAKAAASIMQAGQKLPTGFKNFE
jgi:hypothetical protein